MSKNTMAGVKSLFNTQSFVDKAAFAKSAFKDEGGIILARNLEHVSTEVFNQEYAGQTFLNQGITVNNEGGFSTSITKLKMAVNGSFKEAGTTSNTNGKISLSGESDTMRSYLFDGESDWTEIQLKQSELEGVNLVSRYFEGHSELYSQKIDEVGYLGVKGDDGSQKTFGLLNYPFESSAADDTAEALTGENLYKAIAGIITAQWNGVLNVETFKANHVTMPDTVYNTLSLKILNSNGSEMTVLKALQTNFTGITFGSTVKARDAGASGASVVVAFSTNRRAMQMRIPVPFNISSVDQRGFKYYVESYFGIAGLDVIESTAGRILTGL